MKHRYNTGICLFLRFRVGWLYIDTHPCNFEFGFGFKYREDIKCPNSYMNVNLVFKPLDGPMLGNIRHVPKSLKNVSTWMIIL